MGGFCFTILGGDFVCGDCVWGDYVHGDYLLTITGMESHGKQVGMFCTNHVHCRLYGTIGPNPNRNPNPIFTKAGIIVKVCCCNKRYVAMS